MTWHEMAHALQVSADGGPQERAVRLSTLQTLRYLASNQSGRTWYASTIEYARPDVTLPTFHTKAISTTQHALITVD